ncbi:hypothetical protein ACJ73_09730, partial [Blastomyces percursus]
MYPSLGTPSGVTCFNEPSGQDFMQRASPGVPMHWNAVYYANWRANNIPPPSALNLGYISHIFYAFACNEWVDEHQPVDGTRGYLRALVQRKHDSQVKVLLSIGGGGIGSKNFAAIAGNPAAVEIFLSSAAELANKFNLDGFDINWEHPESLEQGYDYNTLLYRMREKFPNPYLLTTALSAGQWVLNKINLVEAHLYVDFINLMTYDFSGPWTPHSGHHAQLHAPPAAEVPGQRQNAAATNSTCTMSCSSGVAYLLSWGVPANKILLGIPAYGRAFPGAYGIDQLYQRGAGEKVFDYRELPLPGTEEVHDDVLGAAYCVDVGGGGSGGGGGL